jgi:serine/threonine-protein kinase
LLYEMLAGKHPFDKSLPANELFALQRFTPPPPISERNPEVEVPEALEAVVRRMLEKDPENRYPDASTAIGALDDALSDTPGYAVHADPNSIRPSRLELPASLPEPEPSMAQRLRAWASPSRLIGLGVVLVGVLALMLLVTKRAPEPPPPAPAESAAPVAPPPPPPAKSAQEPFESAICASAKRSF